MEDKEYLKEIASIRTEIGNLKEIHKLTTEIEVLKERISNRDEALKLQAIEYEKRLLELNNESGRLKKMREELVIREVYERDRAEDRKELGVLTTYKTKQEGRSQLVQYIPWIFIIASLVLAYLSYTKK